MYSFISLTAIAALLAAFSPSPNFALLLCDYHYVAGINEKVKKAAGGQGFVKAGRWSLGKKLGLDKRGGLPDVRGWFDSEG